jgi:hypothetical protein
MNRDETTAILRLRWQLTGQSLSDQTVDAWSMALANHDYIDARLAMNEAAMKHENVNLFHVFAELPTIAPIADEPLEACQLCGGDGWRNVGWPQRHYPRTCRATTEDECYCHAVEPCVCTAGQRHQDAYQRAIEHNRRTTGINHGRTTP